MKVELNENIQSISGRLGNLIFTTRMGRDGKPRVFAHRLPAPRRTKPSKREIAGRPRFGAIGRAVQLKRKAGDKRPHKVIWEEVAAEYDANLSTMDAHSSYIGRTQQAHGEI